MPAEPRPLGAEVRPLCQPTRANHRRTPTTPRLNPAHVVPPGRLGVALGGAFAATFEHGDYATPCVENTPALRASAPIDAMCNTLGYDEATAAVQCTCHAARVSRIEQHAPRALIGTTQKLQRSMRATQHLMKEPATILRGVFHASEATHSYALAHVGDATGKDVRSAVLTPEPSRRRKCAACSLTACGHNLSSWPHTEAFNA